MLRQHIDQHRDFASECVRTEEYARMEFAHAPLTSREPTVNSSQMTFLQMYLKASKCLLIERLRHSDAWLMFDHASGH